MPQRQTRQPRPLDLVGLLVQVDAGVVQHPALEVQGGDHRTRVTGDNEWLTPRPARRVEHRTVRQPHDVLGVLHAAVVGDPAHDPRVGEPLAQRLGRQPQRLVIPIGRERWIRDPHHAPPRRDMHHVQIGTHRRGQRRLHGARTEVLQYLLNVLQRLGERAGLRRVLRGVVPGVDVERRLENRQMT